MGVAPNFLTRFRSQRGCHSGLPGRLPGGLRARARTSTTRPPGTHPVPPAGKTGHPDGHAFRASGRHYGRPPHRVQSREYEAEVGVSCIEAGAAGLKHPESVRVEAEGCIRTGRAERGDVLHRDRLAGGVDESAGEVPVIPRGDEVFRARSSFDADVAILVTPPARLPLAFFSPHKSDGGSPPYKGRLA